MLGANGAGKTTTLKAVAGLEKPASGTVVLDGEDITGLAAAQGGAARASRWCRRGVASSPR